MIKGLAGIPVLAVFAGAFVRNMADLGPDAVSGATIKVDFKQKKDLKGKLPDRQTWRSDMSAEWSWAATLSADGRMHVI